MKRHCNACTPPEAKFGRRAPRAREQALHEESKHRTHEVIAEKTKTCGNILFRESDLFLYQKFITGCEIYNFSRNLPEIYGTMPWAEIYGVAEKHRPCPGTATRN